MSEESAHVYTVAEERANVWFEMRHRALCEYRVGKTDMDTLLESECSCGNPRVLDEYEAAVRAEERATVARSGSSAQRLILDHERSERLRAERELAEERAARASLEATVTEAIDNGLEAAMRWLEPCDEVEICRHPSCEAWTCVGLAISELRRALAGASTPAEGEQG